MTLYNGEVRRFKGVQTDVSRESDLIMALGKVLIAAAWADGVLAPEEVNCLKDLLFRLPKLNAQQWSHLDIYIDSQVREDERMQLVTDLEALIRTPDEKALAEQTLQDLVGADAGVSDEERQVVEAIRRQIEQVDVGLLASARGLMQGAIGRRSQALGREAFLDDFVKNPVYYTLGRKQQAGELTLPPDLSEQDLRKMGLAGGLMAHIASVDRKVTEAEVDTMAKALQTEWSLSSSAAELVARVAISKTAAEADFYRLSRRFFESTQPSEREAFLRVLFQVAAADGQASNDEIETIRTMAQILKLTHKQFIDAKLTLPRTLREV